MVQVESTDLPRLKSVDDRAVEEMAKFKMPGLLENRPSVRERKGFGKCQRELKYQPLLRISRKYPRMAALPLGVSSTVSFPA